MFFRKSLIFTTTLFLLTTTSLFTNASDTKITGNNWMGSITTNPPSHSPYLSELNIPGTHDSGTYRWPFGHIKCQNFCMNIEKQLNLGCRFLDIRLVLSEGIFWVHHDYFSCIFLQFDRIMSACKKFLEKNPSETIILSVKQANPKKDNFAIRLCSYFLSEPYKDIMFLDDYIPKLEAVRGRIVLMRRYSNNYPTPPIGIYTDFKYNDTFKYKIGTKPGTWSNCISIDEYLYCEDNCKTPIENKKKKIIANLMEAKSNSGFNPSSEPYVYTNNLFITFASGVHISCGLASPFMYSRSINPWLLELFKKKTYSPKGIIVWDYVNEELSKVVWESNFPDGKKL